MISIVAFRCERPDQKNARYGIADFVHDGIKVSPGYFKVTGLLAWNRFKTAVSYHGRLRLFFVEL